MRDGKKRNHQLLREEAACSKDCSDDEIEGTIVKLLMPCSSLALFSMADGEVDPSTVRMGHLGRNLHFREKIMAIKRTIHSAVKGSDKWGSPRVLVLTWRTSHGSHVVLDAAQAFATGYVVLCS